MIEPKKMDLTSMDVAAEKREELKRALGQAFPEVFSEGSIDFDQLKRVLGEWVEPGKERFGLNWPGKAECMKVIQQPSVATLKPMRDESVNFDETENLFIEGDNLEVLKLLQKAYFGKVKMIYIDPPYNTGKEFIYPDKFSESLETYLAYTNQIDDSGKKFSTNSDTSGRYHSRWLNMMYPRLYLAKNLMRKDGFIIISIDDEEVNNLKMLMDDVFGPENFIANLVWDRNRKNDAKYFSVGHEYMLVYAKDESYLRENSIILRAPKDGVDDVREVFSELRKQHGKDWNLISAALREWFAGLEQDDPRKPLARFSKVDEKGPFRDDGNINWPGGGGPTYDVFHPTTKRVCKKPVSGWRYPTIERFHEEVKKGRIVFGPDENTVPRVRTNLFENSDQVIGSVNFSYAQTATVEFSELFDGKRVFENPKNFRDISKLIGYLTGPDDIILDFFAGSGTTAHAVYDQNTKDEGQRKFILVQLPEPITTNDDALSIGFKTIADLSRERIKRSAAKILNQYEGQLAFSNKPKDCFGFRAFSLSNSNFKIWNGTAESFDTVGSQLDLHIDHVDQAAHSDDILYELLMKAGFPLTTKVASIELAGKQVFSIEGGALLICLEKEITPKLIDALAEANPLQVICLDEGFKGNDQLKANAVQTFKARAQAEESEIVFRTV